MFIYICIYTVIIFEMLCQCRLYLGIHIHKQTALPLLISIRFWFSIHLWTTSNLKKSVYIYIYICKISFFWNIFTMQSNICSIYRLLGGDVSHSIDVWESVTRPILYIDTAASENAAVDSLFLVYICCMLRYIYIYMYKYVVVKAWAIAKASKIVDPWEPVAGPIPSTTGDKAPWSWNLRSYFPEGVLCTSQRNHLLLNSKIHDACWAVEKLLNGTEKNLQCWNMLGKRHS